MCMTSYIVEVFSVPIEILGVPKYPHEYFSHLDNLVLMLWQQCFSSFYLPVNISELVNTTIWCQTL